MDGIILPSLHLSSPSDGLVEGEILLPAGRAGNQALALLFAQQLIDYLIPPEGWRESSFSIKWTIPPGEGRLYGQAWFERFGTTVHFIAVRLVDESGQPIAVATTTAHHSNGGTD